MDIDRLTPAPWHLTGMTLENDAGVARNHEFVVSADDTWICEMIQDGTCNAEFIVLARNAFDVMMRRGWNPTLRVDGQWIVEERDGSVHSKGTDGWPDPFTALVEADAFWTARPTN